MAWKMKQRRFCDEICAGEHMHPSDIKEGKIELIADTDGLLKINREALVAVNSLGEMMIASRHGDFPCVPEINWQERESFR